MQAILTWCRSQCTTEQGEEQKEAVNGFPYFNACTKCPRSKMNVLDMFWFKDIHNSYNLQVRTLLSKFLQYIKWENMSGG